MSDKQDQLSVGYSLASSDALDLLIDLAVAASQDCRVADTVIAERIAA